MDSSVFNVYSAAREQRTYEYHGKDDDAGHEVGVEAYGAERLLVEEGESSGSDKSNYGNAQRTEDVLHVAVVAVFEQKSRNYKHQRNRHKQNCERGKQGPEDSI